MNVTGVGACGAAAAACALDASVATICGADAAVCGAQFDLFCTQVSLCGAHACIAFPPVS
jgi:hypothetical protein